MVCTISEEIIADKNRIIIINPSVCNQVHSLGNNSQSVRVTSRCLPATLCSGLHLITLIMTNPLMYW